MVTNPAFIICSVQSLTYRLYSKGENSASILGDEGLVNWDTKHWRDFLKLLGLYLAEDYTENLLQLHDAEIVRLRNYYEVHLLHCRQIISQLSYKGSPSICKSINVIHHSNRMKDKNLKPLNISRKGV